MFKRPPRHPLRPRRLHRRRRSRTSRLLDEVGHVRTSLIELGSLETLVDAPVDERTPRVRIVG